MTRNRLIVLAVVVLVFVVGAGYLIYSQVGGGGASRTIDVTVAGNTMTPDRWTAKQGDYLTVNVTTDKAEEIHLHGYDIKFAGKAGQKVSQAFKADKAGTFPIEIEDAGTEIGSLVVNP